MLLKNADNPLKLVLAAHPKLAEAIQVQLASDSSYKVRINLAKNLQVTSEVQETLASDTNADVKIALLGNPALCLSEEAKLKLAKFKIENNSPAARMLNMQRNSGLFGNIAATLYSTEN